MKVLHIGKSDLEGGAARAAFRIHQSLREAGVQSQMLVGNKRSDDPDVHGPTGLASKAWDRVAPYIDAIPLRFSRSANQSPRSPAWVGSAVATRARASDSDVIHLHWICGGLMRPQAVASLAEKPLVWRLADMWPFSGTEHYVGDSVRYREGYTRLNRPPGESGFDADRWAWNRKLRAWRSIRDLTLVAPSRWMARCANESVLFRDRRVEIVPTGQDIHQYRPIRKELARELLGLPKEPQLVLFGAMSPLSEPRKGIRFLEPALSELARAGFRSSCQLVVIGASRASAPCFTLPMPAHYLGRLSDDVALALAYSSADVFLAPSTEENLANTVIESLACGTPVVAFDVGGMSDAVRHKTTGYLAQPFSASDLAHGLAWVLADPGRREALSEAGRTLVESEFSLETQARRYIDLYQDVIAQSRLEQVVERRNRGTVMTGR